MGLTDASYTGDIAIDDVSLMDGFCTGDDYSFNLAYKSEEIL